MEETISEIKALFYDDLIIEAYRKIKAHEGNAEAMDAINMVPEVHLIRTEVAVIEQVLQELGDMPGWT
jgi:hypothetical protein